MNNSKLVLFSKALKSGQLPADLKISDDSVAKLHSNQGGNSSKPPQNDIEMSEETAVVENGASAMEQVWKLFPWNNSLPRITKLF